MLERRNIEAAVERAIDRRDSEQTGPLCQAYTLVSEACSSPAATVDTLQRASDSVDLEPVWRVKLLHSLAIGLSVAQVGSDAAQLVSAEAVELARLHGDARQYTRAQIDSTLWALHAGRHEEALSLLKDARAMAEQLGDARYVLAADLRIASHLMRVGRFGESQKATERALTAARKGADLRMLGKLLITAAINEQFLGHADRAQAHLRESISVAREIGHPYKEGHSGAVLADFLQLDDQAAEARRVGIEALAVLRPLGAQRSVGIASYGVAMAALQLGELDAAESHVATALTALRGIGDLYEVVTALSCRARISHAQGDAVAADAALDEATAIIEAEGIAADSEPAVRLGEASAIVKAKHPADWLAHKEAVQR